MKLSPLLCASIAFAAVLGTSRAADPASEDERWGAAVRLFAQVLDGSASHEALDKLVSDHSWVAPFARNRTEAVSVLPSQLAGMRIVSAHSYLQPSVSSASDLVADILADSSLDPALRKKLGPPDGRDLRQADATMARWFSAVLEAQPGDPVALIAMYDDGLSLTEGMPNVPASLTLLLLRGEFVPDGSARINRVLYGTLEAAVR